MLQANIESFSGGHITDMFLELYSTVFSSVDRLFGNIKAKNVFGQYVWTDLKFEISFEPNLSLLQENPGLNQSANFAHVLSSGENLLLNQGIEEYGVNSVTKISLNRKSKSSCKESLR